MHRLLLALFSISSLAAFVCSLTPDPEAIAGTVPDYVLHAGVFALLSVLGFAAFPRLDRAYLFLLLACFGALIEVVQGQLAFHRDADWHDWLADLISVFCVMAIMPPRRFERPVAGVGMRGQASFSQTAG